MQPATADTQAGRQAVSQAFVDEQLILCCCGTWGVGRSWSTEWSDQHNTGRALVDRPEAAAAATTEAAATAAVAAVAAEAGSRSRGSSRVRWRTH
jgi:hypothetical protein